MPDKLFFNTSIATYIWILTNRKLERRRGKIQLINGVSFFDSMKRNLGAKSVFISESHIERLVEIYTDFEECEHSKIYPNEFFGYTKVIIERPLVEKREIRGEEKEVVVKDKKGVPKPDPALREDERIPFAEDIGDYFRREIKPHLPDGWMDRKKDKVGYEINFNRYFYRHTPLRSPQEIADEMRALEGKNEGLLRDVLELVDSPAPPE